MSFTQDDVKKLAKLAKISINSKDPLADSIVDDLNKILALVEQINEIDTNNIEPLGHPIEQEQSLRADEAVELNIREQMLSMIDREHQADGMYLVPKVVD